MKPSTSKMLSRRSFAASLATVGSLAALRPAAQGAEQTVGDPVRYPDARIETLDPRFGRYAIGNTHVQRLYHSPNMLWAEGCAWNGVGRCIFIKRAGSAPQRRFSQHRQTRCSRRTRQPILPRRAGLRRLLVDYFFDFPRTHHAPCLP